MDDCGRIPAWTGERVERTNVRGRHSYCEPFKAWIVEQAMRPGMSMAGLAMRNEVNANQLRRWVQLHRRRTSADGVGVKLLPVTLDVPAAKAAWPTSSQGAAVEVELAGAIVRVRDDVAPAMLRMVLQAVRGTAP